MVRRERPAFQMLPTRQRLDFPHLAVDHADFRLVVQRQLMLINCPAKLRRKREAIRAVQIILVCVHGKTQAGVFRLIQGNIGTP